MFDMFPPTIAVDREALRFIAAQQLLRKAEQEEREAIGVQEEDARRDLDAIAKGPLRDQQFSDLNQRLFKRKNEIRKKYAKKEEALLRAAAGPKLTRLVYSKR